MLFYHPRSVFNQGNKGFVNISLFMQLQKDLPGHQAARSFLLHRHIAAIRKLFSGKKKKNPTVDRNWYVSTNKEFHTELQTRSFVPQKVPCRSTVAKSLVVKAL